LSKSLKKIYGYKINPANKDSNINQQAGFAAEVKTAAREDAEKIISGNNKTKTVRTDDMAKQSDGKGNTIGGNNDQLYDIAEVDKNGIYVEGTARQLKFVGGTPEKCTDALLNKDWDKYRDADVPIEVPSDFYDGVKKELEDRANGIKDQIADAEAKGNTHLVEKKKSELERVEKTSNNLKKGKLTKSEANEARLHPKWSTVKDITKVAHSGGVEAAQSVIMISGGIAFIRNSVSVIKGDKDIKEAAIDMAKSTAGAGALGYVTGFSGAAIKGALQNAPSTYLRALSKTNLPAATATTVLEVGQTLSRYAHGDIDGTDCLIELGEKGTAILSSAMFATKGALVGTMVMPVAGTVVGVLVGGMIGYAFSSSYYRQLISALIEAKEAHEERKRIEAEC